MSKLKKSFRYLYTGMLIKENNIQAENTALM